MGLSRVSRSYLADDGGLRELANSSEVARETLAAAQTIATAAAAAGKSEYGVHPEIVTAGWTNERRAGAVVWEKRPDWRDTRDAVLVTVLDKMRRRG
jgi:hypothetical protein